MGLIEEHFKFGFRVGCFESDKIELGGRAMCRGQEHYSMDDKRQQQTTTAIFTVLLIQKCKDIKRKYL